MCEALKQAALRMLQQPPSRETLLEFIRWLDLECSEAPVESVQVQILVRSMIAVGHRLLEELSISTVAATVATAESFVLEPSEERHDHYFAAATDSYPFGSGDGCYALAELGNDGCSPGSGCISGAGSLGCFSEELGDAVVMEVIAGELIPWLRGETEPIRT
jgi:hypothetical protein